MGDAVATVALVTLVVEISGSASAVGGALIARLLPTLASPLFGVLADRLDRRAVLVATDLLRAALALAFVFVRDLAAIYALIFLTGAARPLQPHDPGRVPRRGGGGRPHAGQLPDQRHLQPLHHTVGPALGGLLVAAIGVDAPFVVDAATAVLVSGAPLAAGLIGRETSLPRDQLDALVSGALLHDVGKKIAVPDSVLHKPGPLAAEEYETIKRHPVAGAEIVAPLEEPAPAVPAIRHRHERFDGGGYPNGLRGEDIPLTARVVCVADAFDTMTRDRRYRRESSVAAALKEIRDKAGTQFDLGIVAAFLRATDGANSTDTTDRRANPDG